MSSRPSMPAFRRAARYLLHGAGDNASTWHRLTTIELYAAKYGCTVIMPEANRSYYTDMEYGLEYFRYVTQELPDLAAGCSG
ncbi:hypothetical protein VQ056_16860 [Paenibacillus sp. JTLBN-2024]